MRCSAHLLLSGHRAERQKTIPCLLLTQGERMRNFHCMSQVREVSQQLILELVDSHPLFILKTALNDPF